MSHRTLLNAAMIRPYQEIAANLNGTARLVKRRSRRLAAVIPAASAKPVEISRQYRLDRRRRDPEARQGQCPRRDDVVVLQQLDLVRGQRRVWENRHEPCLHPGDPEREIDKPAS